MLLGSVTDFGDDMGAPKCFPLPERRADLLSLDPNCRARQSGVGGLSWAS